MDLGMTGHGVGCISSRLTTDLCWDYSYSPVTVPAPTSELASNPLEEKVFQYFFNHLVKC